jgi:uncharacterized protein YndB with AHSA1/START domain
VPGALMPDILHDFPVNARPARVFEALSDPKVLDAWWTLRSSGQPKIGETYELFFGGRRRMTTIALHPFAGPCIFAS